MYLKSAVIGALPTGTSPELQIVNITNQGHLSGIFCGREQKKQKTGFGKPPGYWYTWPKAGPITRVDGKVIFISGAVPGDVADVLVTKKKRRAERPAWHPSTIFREERTTPFCKHFGVLAAANGRWKNNWRISNRKPDRTCGASGKRTYPRSRRSPDRK